MACCPLGEVVRTGFGSGAFRAMPSGAPRRNRAGLRGECHLRPPPEPIDPIGARTRAECRGGTAGAATEHETTPLSTPNQTFPIHPLPRSPTSSPPAPRILSLCASPPLLHFSVSGSERPHCLVAHRCTRAAGVNVHPFPHATNDLGPTPHVSQSKRCVGHVCALETHAIK